MALGNVFGLGFGSPFFKLYYGDMELVNEYKTDTNFPKFTYRYADDDDDYLELIVKSKNRYLADQPAFQENVQWRIVWGYLKSVDRTALLGPTRIVYLKDIDAEYNVDGVTLTIRAYDKAAISLKKEQSGQIHHDKTVGEIAAEICAPYGIMPEAVYVKTTEDKLLGIKTEKIEIKTTVIPSQEAVFARFYRSQFLKDPNNAEAFRIFRDRPESWMIQTPPVFIVHEEQIGSTTLWNFLRRVLKDEPNGPFTMSGRDDKLIVQQRSLGQPLQKNFHWEGGKGELLKFNPETRNKVRKSKARKIKVMGFDPILKQQVETWVDATTDADESGNPIIDNPFILDKEEYLFLKGAGGLSGDTASAKAQSLSPEYKKYLSELYNININTADVSFLVKPSANGKYEVRFQFTGTAITNQSSGATSQITYNQEEKIMQGKGDLLSAQIEKSLDQANITTGARSTTAVVLSTIAVIPGRVIMNALRGVNVEDLAKANNERKTAALELNPATARCIGDPRVESEKTINIINAARKHSGLYYTKEVKHVIDSGGFFNEYTLMRDGLGETGEEDVTKVKVEEPIITPPAPEPPDLESVEPPDFVYGRIEYTPYDNSDADFHDTNYSNIKFVPYPPDLNKELNKPLK